MHLTAHENEALLRVQEAVDAQGGDCRNVSAMLQSSVRKIEKRKGKEVPTNDESGNGKQSWADIEDETEERVQHVDRDSSDYTNRCAHKGARGPGRSCWGTGRVAAR